MNIHEYQAKELFDRFGVPREGIITHLDEMMELTGREREQHEIGQGFLFDDLMSESLETTLRDAPHADEAERLAREREVLGFYLSGHPFEKRGAFLRRLAGQCSADVPNLPPGSSVRVAGMISSVRVLQIRSGRNAGQKMARFQLEDLDGTIPVTCFARAYQADAA